MIPLALLTSIAQITQYRVCLLHSKTPSILKVILHSPSTAMFKILTPTYLYDFYPSLTANGVALIVSKYIHNSLALVYGFGMRSYPINSPLYRDCIHVCPVKVRSTQHLTGVIKLRWSFRDESRFLSVHSDTFQEEDLQWRLSDHCYNHACENGGRPMSLHDNIPLILHYSMY